MAPIVDVKAGAVVWAKKYGTKFNMPVAFYSTLRVSPTAEPQSRRGWTVISFEQNSSRKLLVNSPN